MSDDVPNSSHGNNARPQRTFVNNRRYGRPKPQKHYNQYENNANGEERGPSFSDRSDVNRNLPPRLTRRYDRNNFDDKQYRPSKNRHQSNYDQDASGSASNSNNNDDVVVRGNVIDGRYVKNRNKTARNESHRHHEPSEGYQENGYAPAPRYRPKPNFHRSGPPKFNFLEQYQGISTSRPFRENTSFSNNVAMGYQDNNTGCRSKFGGYRNKYVSNGYKNQQDRHESDLEGASNAPSYDDSKKWESNQIIKDESNFQSGVSSNQKDHATQRERLADQLSKGKYECLICYESIRMRDSIWSCQSCYNVFHLHCVRKWANSSITSTEDKTWRCPACQNLNDKVPYNYFCFCGKTKNPDANYHSVPHSCGEICGKSRGEDCPHRCNVLCHPGPCPPCLSVVQKPCACGKTVKALLCSQSTKDTCDLICDKLLNCRVHRCSRTCHIGECNSCSVIISQQCFCGKDKREVPCLEGHFINEKFSCEAICDKLFDCGNHSCTMICHSGPCNQCSLIPDLVKTCPCGKTRLDAMSEVAERKSCTDPIPTCGNTCEKPLNCGGDELHTCKVMCHDGACPPCSLSTSMRCRCSAFKKEFPCTEVASPSFVYLCERRCTRRKNCGKHKCSMNCCTKTEHRCELVCNRKLGCGEHRCKEFCHLGNCPPCGHVSFEELRCYCGTSVLYPPIYCGTRPPECKNPCTRQHACDHPVHHNCHMYENCSPCTVLTQKWCFGHHKQCTNVPCFLDGMSCGMPCEKPLPCGVHKCKQLCHSGPCLSAESKCTQPCTMARSLCGHPCGAPCHDGDCPDNPCKAQVNLVCPCGHRSEVVSCTESTKSHRMMSMSILASKMQDIKDGQSVNISDVLGRRPKNNRLPCNEECAVIERNKRLAVALQIQNPDLSPTPGPPSYSDFLKDEAKKYPHFVSDVYDKITALVQLAKESKQKSRSHSFPSMNRDQRRVVHELAEFFGCETQSYDEEPKKNVVVTAHKAKCWLPFVSIMAIVQRDMGIRKGPTPIFNQRESKKT